MHYKLRIRSTVGRTHQTVYAEGDVIRAGGIDWTVFDASDAVLRGTTAKDASVELAGSAHAIGLTIDGIEVGTFERSGEVGDTRLAAFLDAVVRDLEADWRARAAALQADIPRRSVARRDAHLAAFAAVDLGPAPKPARCHPSELLLRLRSQRRRAGDAEFELRRSGFSVRVADSPAARLRVSAHNAKVDGLVPGTDMRLLVHLTVQDDGDWPRWEQWESPIAVRDGGPDGYAITGDPSSWQRWRPCSRASVPGRCPTCLGTGSARHGGRTLSVSGSSARPSSAPPRKNGIGSGGSALESNTRPTWRPSVSRVRPVTRRCPASSSVFDTGGACPLPGREGRGGRGPAASGCFRVRRRQPSCAPSRMHPLEVKALGDDRFRRDRHFTLHVAMPRLRTVATRSTAGPARYQRARC